jgi:dTDP-4-dehydrorhamnose reductase
VRILVTGGDGLLGRALVPRLRAHHEVEATGTGDADITDRAWLRGRLDAFQPELLVHLAAHTAVDRCETEPEEAFRVNGEGTRVVGEEADRIGAGVLALSTDYVFDGAKGTPYTEEDSPRPLSVYGRSKRAGEEALQASNRAWCIVRSAWLYGPDGPDFVDAILGRLARGEPVRVVDDQRGSPTCSIDLAEGVARLVAVRPRGLFHLVNAGEASWFELAREAARLAGHDPARVVTQSTVELGRPAPRPAYSVLDAGKIGREHGIVLRSWKTALRAHLEPRQQAGTGVAPSPAEEDV